MIVAFLEFCGVLAVALMINLFLISASQRTSSSDSNPDPDIFGEGLYVSTPLRLTGGGDTSGCQEKDISFVNQGRDSLGTDSSPCLDFENDILSSIDPDNSLSEQDIRDILFEAGYTIQDINDIVSSKSKTEYDKSSNSTLTGGEDSESESGIESASDLLNI